MQGLLGPTMGALEAAGWSLDWRAVRRRLNGAADDVATAGVYAAAALARAGTFAPRVHTAWYLDPPPPPLPPAQVVS